ncbi:MAG: DEAD/DEAH box helicase [Gemmatimonadota bacterium]
MIPVNVDGAMHRIDLAAARWLFGWSVLDDASSTVESTLGSVSLMPHQLDAVGRIRTALREFHGALLADDVGLGKTFVALALAREYSSTLVIAPAGLLAMWRKAIDSAGVSGVMLHSLQAYSRRGMGTVPEGSLVIVDEAHHLRTSTTRRYRAVADVLGGLDVLLLSATPVHNRSRELRAQLGLFLGGRADALDPELLARVVVRRTTAIVGTTVQRPTVRYSRPRTFDYKPETLSAIVGLPAPLPAHGGVAAGALIRLGLLRAWCSSDAALAVSITRRRMRGSALRESLVAGRHPTGTELRTWLLGDGDMQLAFPELAAAQEVAPARLLAILDAHLEALSALSELHRRSARADGSRAGALRDLLSREPAGRVIAFSQFGSTIRALYRALSDIAGVGMLSASESRIASGRVTRGDLLRRFAPEAQGVPPPPAHQAVRLLLATDMLAEGVNLQDAHIVVHLDLPWTDALRQQRVGRVARIGSRHRVVQVHTFGAPPPAESALRQLERLSLKASLGEQLVGNADGSRSAADDASAVRALLRSWSTGSPCHELLADNRIAVACAWRQPDSSMSDGDANEPGTHATDALVLLQHRGEWKLLCGSERLSDDAGVVRRCLQAVDREGLDGTRNDRGVPAVSHGIREWESRAVHQVERLVERWHRSFELRAVAGFAPEQLSDAQSRALERVRTVLAAAPPMQRSRLVEAADAAMAMVGGARGEGADRALASWLAASGAASVPEWLRAWSAWPALAHGRRAVEHGASADEVRLRGVILLPRKVVR